MEMIERRTTDDRSPRAEEFESVVERYQRRIFRILLLLLRDSDAADTLTQECFLRAFKKRASFRGESALETWLIRIALNLAHDYRKNKRGGFWMRLVRGGEIREAEARDRHSSPEQLATAREEVRELWAAAEELPTKQRIAFELHFAEDMSLEEIAAAMGVESGTVKSHLARALHTVRSRLTRLRNDRG